MAASRGLSCSRRAVNFLVTAPYAGSGKSPRSRPPCPQQRRGSKPCRRCSAGTSLPISGCLAPSRRGNAALRSPTSTDAPEQPVLDVHNQPDSHRRRRTERRVGARLSRAQDVVGCVAVSGYSPADSRPGCIFMHRHLGREHTILPRSGRSRDQLLGGLDGRRPGESIRRELHGRACCNS